METLLFIEDDDAIRLALSLALEDEGYSVREAPNGTDGLASFDRHPVDLVLLDLALADSSGVETVKRFREVAKQVPLVVLTGSSEEDIGAQSLAAGADAFVPKSGLTAYRIERSIFVTLSHAGEHKI